MKFANWLRRKRESLGYSQECVAKHLEVTRQSVSKWENGRARPDYEMLSMVLQFYKCPEEEILELFNEIGGVRKKSHTLNP